MAWSHFSHNIIVNFISTVQSKRENTSVFSDNLKYIWYMMFSFSKKLNSMLWIKEHYLSHKEEEYIVVAWWDWPEKYCQAGPGGKYLPGNDTIGTGNGDGDGDGAESLPQISSLVCCNFLGIFSLTIIGINVNIYAGLSFLMQTVLYIHTKLCIQNT